MGWVGCLVALGVTEQTQVAIKRLGCSPGWTRTTNPSGTNRLVLIAVVGCR